MNEIKGWTGWTVVFKVGFKPAKEDVRSARDMGLNQSRWERWHESISVLSNGGKQAREAAKEKMKEKFSRKRGYTWHPVLVMQTFLFKKKYPYGYHE